MADFKLVEVKDAGGAPFQALIDIDGRRLWSFMRPPEVTAEVVHGIVNLKLRDGDVMLCSAPKSGSHWVFEIISMLLNGNTETISVQKEQTMLEINPQSELDKIPSPRVLNSHLTLDALPRQLKDKKTKIVLVLRNPKDTAVSYYHHHKGVVFYNYTGKFEDYFPVLLKGELDYGDWFDYVLHMEEEMNKGEYDIHLVYYEDLKENGHEEIKKLAKFLTVSAGDTICQAICTKCDFRNMAKDKTYDPEKVKEILKDGFSIYRKGEIGDWKNYFTVAMSEDFDKYYEERMKNSKLKFKFSPSTY